MPRAKKQPAPMPAEKPIAVFVADCHIGNHARHGGPVDQHGLNRRGRETVDVLRRAVAVAVERGVKAFVSCGDLFDNCRPEPAVIRAVQDVFAPAKEHLQVDLVPGNHEMPDAISLGLNTALAPLRDQATWIADHPGLLFPYLPISAIPFDARMPMAERLAEVLVSETPNYPILATHVGVWDEASASPWQKKARDGISADRLFELMERAGKTHVFVGNYHQGREWRKVGADGVERQIVQVGTLCPHNHGDAGLEGVGRVAFLHESGLVTFETIPGPRFLTVRDPSDLPGKPEAGFSYYVRYRGRAAAAHAAGDVADVESAWVALDVEDEPTDGGVDPVLGEETDEEAIEAAVAEVEVPESVSRDAVRELARECWRRSA